MYNIKLNKLIKPYKHIIKIVQYFCRNELYICCVYYQSDFDDVKFNNPAMITDVLDFIFLERKKSYTLIELRIYAWPLGILIVQIIVSI